MKTAYEMLMDERTWFAVKCIGIYVKAVESLGEERDWSLWRCVYSDDTIKLNDETLSALQCSKLEKRVRDGKEWSVLLHPYSELWVNRDTTVGEIKILKTGKTYRFGTGADGRCFVEVK